MREKGRGGEGEGKGGGWRKTKTGQQLEILYVIRTSSVQLLTNNRVAESEARMVNH